MNLSDISTKELLEELSQRAGVDSTEVEPHNFVKFGVEGPAIVLVVFD